MADTLGVVNSNPAMLKNFRIALGIGGLAALVFGALVLIWPDHTAMAIVAIFVVLWAIIAGLGNLAAGIFGSASGRQRVGYVVLGVLFLAAAVVAWLNLGSVTEVLAFVIGIMVGLVWIIEGVLVLITSAGLGPWPIIYAVVSIFAGVVLVSTPLWGVGLLWLWLGISLVVVGVIQIVRAIRLGR